MANGRSSLMTTARQLVSASETQPTEDDFCVVPPAIDFTVTLTNGRHEDEYPCRDIREARVGYTKWIAATQSVEDVTIEATIPFGSSHTFTVTDAYARNDNGEPDPYGVADSLYVNYQGFNEIDEGSECTPYPLEENKGPSRGFNGLLKDSGVLDVTLLPVGASNTMSWTITNPPAADAASALAPIPDPKFARR
jgi:hypothetical protein